MHDWDDVQDWEYPDPDEGDDDAVDTLTCPECAVEVYAEADSCPACGHFLTAADRSASWASSSRLKTCGRWLLLVLLLLALVGVFNYF